LISSGKYALLLDPYTGLQQRIIFNDTHEMSHLEELVRFQSGFNCILSQSVTRMTTADRPGFDSQHMYFSTTSKSTLQTTERPGRVVNAPASYSGCFVFEPRLRRPVILTEGFRGFPQSLQANAGILTSN
jgi:hypothetical protein